MLSSWLSLINKSLGVIAGLILCIALIVAWMRPSEIPYFDGIVSKPVLPKNAFMLSTEAYQSIGKSVLNSTFSPLSMQLPDLHKSLVYYGKNGRPDAQAQHLLMHFSFTGNKMPASIVPDQKIYVLYDRKSSPPQYIFSPNNEETALWIEVSPQGNQASVKVGMKDDKGTLLTEPQAYALFTLPEKELVRTGAASWDLGGFRADGTLFARQKARWYGIDKFIERHGGPEFSAAEGKQRIDFGEGEGAYSVYVGLNDVMVWDNNRWKVVAPGADSLGRPLLTIKKIDDRLMNVELWDIEGKIKTVINLLKTTETWTPQNIQQSFKFIGARTRSQFVFEINKERLLLSPQDWLVFVDGVWKKLTTPQEIDDFVERRVTGPLFVFDGVERKEDRQVLVGTLFNASRTDMKQIEIPIQQNSTGKIRDEAAKSKVPNQNNIKVIKPPAHSAEDDDDLPEEE